jgi:ATP-dependent exoDNAse (exonuclease V) beta subunit
VSDAAGSFANVVIRASAGTGKTYRLSSRFLSLLAAGESLDNILATTFTRKAAGEILARVLVRIAEAASQPAKLAQLAADLQDPALDRAQCLGMLGALVRRLHRIRVSTLDSFFIQMARAFGLELGLPPGWQIVDEIDDAGLRDEAIRAVLRDEATTDVVRLMHLLTKGEAVRSVRDQIAWLVRDLYEVYLQTGPAAWDALPREKPLRADELQATLEALAGAPCPSDKRFQDAQRTAVEAAEREDWQWLLKQGLTKNALQGDGTYYRKPIPPEMLDACQRLADHARAMLLGRIANQTQATRRLLERFDAAYQALKFSSRALRFDDVTRILGNDAVANRLDEVAYRLDAHVGHLLLDEFQDTSPPQWRVLRPFALRTVDGGPHRSFFCVGDVKQAIYGWRGGVAEIFDAIQQELRGLVSEPLDTSYRSSPVVIELVNRVFQGLADNAALRNYAEAAKRWAARFHLHTTVRETFPGHCRMATAPRAAEGQDQDAATWESAARRIQQLHEQAPGFSIGVLVRRNSAVAWLIRRLRQLGIEASEEGGNPLTDSPARFHVAHSPLGPVVDLIEHDDEARAVALSRRLRAQLMEAGYGPTLYAWACRLAPHCDPRELGRLMQLAEMGYGYQSRATTRVDDFLKVVEKTRIEAPRQADVRVMTVHQAKGLEFDIVVLPELDFRITGQRPQVVVGRPGPTQTIDRVLRYVSKDLWHLLPKGFRDMFEGHERRMVEESLCVLYVSLTRAVHALEIIVAPSSEREKNPPGTYAGVLRTALTSGGRLDAEAVVYQSGDPAWHRGIAPKRPAATAAEPKRQDGPATVRLAAAGQRLSRGLDRRSPSQLEGGAQVQLAQRLRLDTAAAMDRGSLLHAWFELIEWLDGGEPDDDALRTAASTLARGDLDLPNLIGQFRRALARPAVREVLTHATFARPAPSGSAACVHAGAKVTRPQWLVSRECPFAVRDGDAILSGKIDRLVVLRDGDRTVGADVLDFKTDAIPAQDPEALESRVAWYRPQLDAYRRAAAALLRIEPKQISTRLVFTEPGVVVPVD